MQTVPVKLNRQRKLLLFALLFVGSLFVLDRIAAWQHVPRADGKEIVLYTTTWCPYCESLRLYLKAYNIPYKEHDVEKSLAGMMGFWALRGHGVPVSAIGPEVIYGYDMEKIHKALAALGYKIEK